jgi:hypothetical protein
MANSHSVADSAYELQATCADLLPACIRSTTFPAVPAPPSLTLAAFATKVYVQDGSTLVYVDQEAHTVTLTGADGNYWLALTQDTWTTYASYTRVAGTHYAWRANATEPASVDGLLVFCQLVVAGGAITVVTPLTKVTSSPMSKQNSNAVAITGGTAQLTGTYDGTFTLSASGAIRSQAEVVLDSNADGRSAFYTTMAVAGATGKRAINCVGDAPSYFGGPITVYGGLTVAESAAGNNGFYTNYSSGGGRNAIYCAGTAPSYFGGTVQVVGTLGVQTSPASNTPLNLRWNKASQYGMQVWPLDSDSGNAAVMFFNLASGSVGSISTTASATAYNTTSDVRLKHAIAPLTAALERVRALRPVSFKWNADDSPGVGYLAHELMTVVPEAVTGVPDAVDAQGQIVPQQVDHSKIVPWLTAGLQAALAQIDALTARITTLEQALGA